MCASLLYVTLSAFFFVWRANAFYWGSYYGNRVSGSGYGGTGNTTLLCNASIGDANASGLITYPVAYPNEFSREWSNGTIINDPSNVPDPSWAISVSASNSTVQTSLWYDTAGQNYSDDAALKYDVCSIIITSLPLNTVELGQNDPGNCSSIMSKGEHASYLYRGSPSALTRFPCCL